MAIKRLAGSVKINGTSYLILKEKDKLTYERKSIPKTNPSVQTRRVRAGASNLIEYTYGAEGGYGDAVIQDRDDHYHFGVNMYMEHRGEAVILPGHQYTKNDSATYTDLDGVTAKFETSIPPVGIFEIYDQNLQNVTTYIVQDCRVSKVYNSSGAQVTLRQSKVFDTGCMPSDATSFNNIGYVAMGTRAEILDITTGAISGAGLARLTCSTVHNFTVGDLVLISNCSETTYNGIWKTIANDGGVGDGKSFTCANLTGVGASSGRVLSGRVNKLSNRYLRSMTSGQVWSKDDNSYRAITGAVTAGVNGTTFTTSGSHGFSIGDTVQLVGMGSSATAVTYNSMSTANTSTLYQITAVTANTFTVPVTWTTDTVTGYVCRTDSDVIADRICAVGDLLVRSYHDPELGWVTSRVDPIMSNPLLDANWTAGIGTVGVGDVGSPITELVAFGGGELVLKAEGAYVYNQGKGAYMNVIPELEDHRHPDNGKGAVEHKGWVYIPTIIGLLRYRTAQTQNVTPGRGGQQSWETPTGPIGWLVGDASDLYGVTQPFKVNQQKQVSGVQTAIYFDSDGAGTGSNPGTPDFNLDPQVDINGMATTDYLYFGSTQKWHRMHVEMDERYNSLAYALSGLRLTTAEYWTGTTWTTRGTFIDFTRVRNDSAKYPSSFGQSGDIVFTGTGTTGTTGEIPTNWATGATIPSPSSYPNALTTSAGDAGSTMYWMRFRVSAAITNSVIIKRITAGLHVPSVTMTPALAGYEKELTVDHGGVQYVVAMHEEQGKPPVWNTMWAWKTPDTTTTDDNGGAAYITGGAQPVGACAIIQPNALRCAQGARFLFVGLQHNSMVLPLGHGPDPTEDGPYLQQFGGAGREYWLVFPDTDCGLPTTVKTLQEVKLTIDQLTPANVQAFYRVDGGAWTSIGALTATTSGADNAYAVNPLVLTAGAEPQGLMFGLAISISLTADAKGATLPRITTMPALRVQPHPEMSEFITMTVELEPEEGLPGQTDRRSAKTSYAALKSLQTTNVSIPYVDVDETSGYVHIMDCTKHVLHNGDNPPRVVADLTIAVVS